LVVLMSARTAAAPKASIPSSTGSASSGRRRRLGVQVTWFGCDAVDGLEPHALGVTY